MDNCKKDQDLFSILQKTGEETENTLDILLKLKCKDGFVGRLLTVKEYSKYILDTLRREISDATIRNIIVKGTIDGLYSRNSPNIKYLIFMSDKSKNFTPRKYEKKQKKHKVKL